VQEAKALARAAGSAGYPMNRLLDWMGKSAGDRRIVAWSEEDRDGELWVIVHCRNRMAADSLFDALWDQGWRTLGRHDRDSLWLERSDDTTTAPTGLAPLDLGGLLDF
jgi:hypothetical protein